MINSSKSYRSIAGFAPDCLVFALPRVLFMGFFYQKYVALLRLIKKLLTEGRPDSERRLPFALDRVPG